MMMMMIIKGVFLLYEKNSEQEKGELGSNGCGWGRGRGVYKGESG